MIIIYLIYLIYKFECHLKTYKWTRKATRYRCWTQIFRTSSPLQKKRKILNRIPVGSYRRGILSRRQQPSSGSRTIQNLADWVRAKASKNFHTKFNPCSTLWKPQNKVSLRNHRPTMLILASHLFWLSKQNKTVSIRLYRKSLPNLTSCFNTDSIKYGRNRWNTRW